jgi:hypothetical protein
MVLRNVVSDGFFATLGTPIVAGRDFDLRDGLSGARTVIVNQAFVDKYFAGANPIGRVIAENPDPSADLTPLEIVGVVGNAIYRSSRDPAPPTMYWSFARTRRPSVAVKLVVRSGSASPEMLTRSVTAAVLSVHPDLTVSVRAFSDQIGASITQERIVATLAGFFGGLALMLAALGLYGITAYAVTRRQIELGIRMALGTTPGGVVRLVLSRVGLLVGGGLAIGAIVSWWASKLAAALLYGVEPRDPLTFVGAAVVLASIALFAGLIPAHRASRIDPAVVLREG